MPSPFPGMDPYLEGYLWPDVHNALAAKVRQLLTPLIRPRYGPVQLQDTLPNLPIPLRAPDADVVLDLGAALRAVYDEAGYDLSIDYQKDPPPPALTPHDAQWVAQQIRK